MSVLLPQRPQFPTSHQSTDGSATTWLLCTRLSHSANLPVCLHV